MEFFRNPNIDFLGKKWYFLAFSLVFSVAGLLSMLFWHGIPLGVDFRGGTLVYVKFSHTPEQRCHSRRAWTRVGLHNAKIQRYGRPANNEVLIDLAEQETNEAGSRQGQSADHRGAGDQCSGGQAGSEQRQFFDNQKLPAGERSPCTWALTPTQKYTALAQAIVNYRDKTKGGVLSSLDELKAATDPAVVASLQDGFYLSDFGVRNVEIVGPQVGKQLQKQAMLAVAVFAGRNAGLPGVPVRMDLRRGCGRDGVPRYVDHRRRVFADRTRRSR